MLLGCCGCETISFRQENHDFETVYQVAEDEWEHEVVTHIYPRVIEDHHEPRETWLIPSIVLSIYEESLEAIKNGSRILAGLGFRGTIEAICIDRRITGKDLGAKISNLSKQGLISKSDAKLLHSIRFLGNDAAHEIAQASKQQLKAALLIIEHLLRSLYIVPNETGGLEGVIDDYKDFLKLLNVIVESEGVESARSLSSILGRRKRRILADLPAFEKQLISDIQSGAVKWLGLGSQQMVGEAGKEVSVQLFEGKPEDDA